MRVTRLAVLLLVAALTWPAVAQQVPGPAPGPAPAPSAPGRGPGGMAGPMDVGRMVDMLAQGVGLTEAEKAATKKAVTAKLEARAALQQQLQALSEVAGKHKPTDKELTAALKKFDATLAAYRQKTKTIDAQLVKALSLKARVALTAVGVIDNGIGVRFGRGSGMMRGPGAGGFGGPGTGMRRPQGSR